MSKGNMLLGHARGKVGDLVFSRSNGEQVTRARAAVVKNPQTQKQMIQRILLNTVAQAYSKMSAITDHSFEGIQQGQKTMSAFMKRNLDLLRARVSAASGLYNVYAFSPIGQNIFAVNSFEIARGSLPVVIPSLVEDDETGEFKPTLALLANTYEAVLQQYGLNRGDQLTFITLTQKDDNTYFLYRRVILNPVDASGNELPMSTTFIVDGAINAASDRNEGQFVNLSYNDNAVIYSEGDRVTTVATAIIVSRQKSDGEWLRSNSTLVIDDDALQAFGISMGEALDLFEQGGISLLSDVYLNNAGSRKLTSNEAPAPEPEIFAVAGKVGDTDISWQHGNTYHVAAGILTLSSAFINANGATSLNDYQLKLIKNGGGSTNLGNFDNNGVFQKSNQNPQLQAGMAYTMVLLLSRDYNIPGDSSKYIRIEVNAA